jgi:hypothetical protein
VKKLQRELIDTREQLEATQGVVQHWIAKAGERTDKIDALVEEKHVLQAELSGVQWRLTAEAEVARQTLDRARELRRTFGNYLKLLLLERSKRGSKVEFTQAQVEAAQHANLHVKSGSTHVLRVKPLMVKPNEIPDDMEPGLPPDACGEEVVSDACPLCGDDLGCGPNEDGCCTKCGLISLGTLPKCPKCGNDVDPPRSDGRSYCAKCQTWITEIPANELIDPTCPLCLSPADRECAVSVDQRLILFCRRCYGSHNLSDPIFGLAVRVTELEATLRKKGCQQ